MQGHTAIRRIVQFTARSASMLVLIATFTPVLLAQWTEQGPGPIKNGQDEGITNNPVSGAVNAIAPVDANTVYVATVNGGIWKTTDATSASPTWTQLTDTALSALSIKSLAVSPLDSNLIFAGTGSSSSLSSSGSPGIGVARSTDGGTKWTVEAATPFAGTRIESIVPSSTTGSSVVLAGVHFQNYKGPNPSTFGLYRSTDNAKAFTQR